MRYALAILTLFAAVAVFAQEPAPDAPAAEAKQPATQEAAPAEKAPADKPAPSETAAPAEAKGDDAAEAKAFERERADSLFGARDIEGAMEKIADYLSTMEKQSEPAPDREKLKLNARQCVDMALSQNAKVLVADDDVAAAQARVGQARSAFYPQISASSGFAKRESNDPPRSTTQAQSIMQLMQGASSAFESGRMPILRTILSMEMGSLTSSSAMTPADTVRQDTFTVKQVFYAGGQVRAGVRASEYLAQSQEWQREATRAGLEFDAKKAYYDCLLTRALQRVAEESVKTFERQLADAKQMFEVGMVSHFQVLRAETELGARKADAVAAKNGVRLAETNLLCILALPQDTPVELEPKLEWLPYVAPTKDLVQYADEHRPELLALQKGIQASEQDVKRTRGQFAPQVAGSAEYKNTDRGGYSLPDGWTFTLGAQWDISTGGKRIYQVQEAKARLSSLEHQLQDVERLVELDVTQSYIQIQDSMAKIHSERGTVELAREGLRLAELRFQEGVGTQVEVLDAELALTSAETSLVQALHDYSVAHASLERAIGKSWTKPEEEAPAAAQPAGTPEADKPASAEEKTAAPAEEPKPEKK